MIRKKTRERTRTRRQPVFSATVYALARIVTFVPIETVVLRRKDDRIQVLLTRRPSDDEYYPGMIHIPGTILRASDRRIEDAFARVQEGEIKKKFSRKPEFVGFLFIHTLHSHSKRA